MEEEQLNKLVMDYQRGNEDALEALCRHFLPIINHESEQIWYKVKNNTKFECRCVMKIGKALLRYDPKKGKVSSLVMNIIVKERSDFTRRRRKKFADALSLDALAINGCDTALDIKDDLAVVEENVIAKEMIAMLAQGDQIKEFILVAWMNGINNDSKLAEMLAHSFGSKQESYRKYIQRFRAKCKRQLETA